MQTPTSSTNKLNLFPFCKMNGENSLPFYITPLFLNLKPFEIGSVFSMKIGSFSQKKRLNSLPT